MPARFSLNIHAGRYASHVSYLRRNLLRARELIAAPLEQYSVVLIGNRAMSGLHQQFMNLPDPTDVLTFPMDLDSRGRPISGEVFVCVPYAANVAKLRRIEPRKELLLYALHGMLHLCGFDDRTDRGFAQMHRKEDRILQQLGVGAVFSPTKSASKHVPKTLARYSGREQGEGLSVPRQEKSPHPNPSAPRSPRQLEYRAREPGPNKRTR